MLFFPKEGQEGVTCVLVTVPVILDFLYLQKVRNMALDDVVILNVDTNTLETPFDDLQSLPNDVVGTMCEFWLLSAHVVILGLGDSVVQGLVYIRVTVVDTAQC